MKIKFLIIVYILVCVRTLNSQNGRFLLNSGTNRYLNDIIFIGQDTGYVGADFGQLLITFNAGRQLDCKKFSNST